MDKNSKEYWNSQYEANDIGWDIGYASPPIATYIEQLKSKDISILIPGCGNGYEASLLLEKGFSNITVIDIAPLLTDALKKKFADRLGKGIEVVTGDFFQLKGSFDLVLEQTFMSTMPPNLRVAYRDKMFELVKPGGKLAGVIFASEFSDEGPPFGTDREQYKKLFEDKFKIKTMEICYNSIPRRAGNELFIILQREK